MTSDNSERKVSHLNFHTLSIDEAVAFLSSEYSPVKVKPITKNRVDMAVSATMIGGLCFSNTKSHSGMELSFEEPFDGYGFSFADNGSFVLEMTKGNHIAPERTNATTVDSREVRCASMLPGTFWRRMSISSAAVHERAEILADRSMKGRIVFSNEIQPRSGMVQLTLSLADAMQAGLADDAPLLHAPLALASMYEAALSVILEGFPNNYSSLFSGRLLSPAPRHVKRAIDFMVANAALPIQLEEIAVAAGTSPRTLQLSFKKFRNTTPIEYLRKIRLHGVRNDLLSGQPGVKVSQIAYRWGFAHMGIFASYYFKEYGETPSATLRLSSR